MHILNKSHLYAVTVLKKYTVWSPECSFQKLEYHYSSVMKVLKPEIVPPNFEISKIIPYRKDEGIISLFYAGTERTNTYIYVNRGI